MSKLMWSLSLETKQLLKEVIEKIENCKEDLSSGSTLLNSNEEMLKDYIYNIGFIDGLKFVKDYVESTDEQSEAVLGQDESSYY